MKVNIYNGFWCVNITCGISVVADSTDPVIELSLFSSGGVFFFGGGRWRKEVYFCFVFLSTTVATIVVF